MKITAAQTGSNVSAVARHGSGSKAIAQFAAVAQFAGGNKTLGVACNKQEGTNLCWAAVTEAVTGVTQTNLKNTYTGGNDVVNDPKQALIDNGKYSSEVAAKIAWDKLVEQIDLGLPVIILIGPKANAHYVILVGYNGKSNKDKNRLYVVSDPLKGGTENWSADTFNSLTHQGYYLLK